jgi:hypothetical protein
MSAPRHLLTEFPTIGFEAFFRARLSSSGKPSEDIFPRQRLRRAGEEIPDQGERTLAEAWS